MTTANISITSTITGASEGGTDLISLGITNTSAVYSITHSTLTTNSITGAITYPLLTSGVRQVLIVPPSTNTIPFRMAASTSDTGIVLGAADPTLISVSTLSTLTLWTTGASAISGLRVIQL